MTVNWGTSRPVTAHQAKAVLARKVQVHQQHIDQRVGLLIRQGLGAGHANHPVTMVLQ